MRDFFLRKLELAAPEVLPAAIPVRALQRRSGGRRALRPQRAVEHLQVFRHRGVTVADVTVCFRQPQLCGQIVRIDLERLAEIRDGSLVPARRQERKADLKVPVGRERIETPRSGLRRQRKNSATGISTRAEFGSISKARRNSISPPGAS
jgi:hypothetical protein